MFALLKGWFGEKVTSVGLGLSLDRRIYHRIDQLILHAGDGTTQIDHVIVSRFGIFVVETKNMRGWIFGDAGDPQWTQVLFGRKYRFHNPLRQNYRHTRTIAEKLNLDHEAVIPIVFFIGECTFKTALPPGVLCAGLSNYIRDFTQVIFTPEEVSAHERILRDLKTHTIFTNASHVRALRERFASNTDCPKCGGELVERIATTGKNAGGKFLGCSAYPRCRFTKKSPSLRG